jgi:hypothetical protein
MTSYIQVNYLLDELNWFKLGYSYVAAIFILYGFTEEMVPYFSYTCQRNLKSNKQVVLDIYHEDDLESTFEYENHPLQPTRLRSTKLFLKDEYLSIWSIGHGISGSKWCPFGSECLVRLNYYELPA